MGEDFFQSGGGGVALILSLCEGGVEINFCLMRGAAWVIVFGHISPISQPPLQVIITQSLNLLLQRFPLICTSIVFRDRDIVIWQSLLFSQLIKNNLSNRCGIKKDKIWEDVGVNT